MSLSLLPSDSPLFNVEASGLMQTSVCVVRNPPPPHTHTRPPPPSPSFSSSVPPPPPHPPPSSSPWHTPSGCDTTRGGGGGGREGVKSPGPPPPPPSGRQPQDHLTTTPYWLRSRIPSPQGEKFPGLRRSQKSPGLRRITKSPGLRRVTKFRACGTQKPTGSWVCSQLPHMKVSRSKFQVFKSHIGHDNAPMLEV